MKRTIYVGLPCYNEEKDISTLIRRILKVGVKLKKKLKCELKIICVNDGSVDKTKEIISELALDSVLLVNHEVNRGLGEAVKTILIKFNEIAHENDFLVVMDADNTHNPNYIFDLINKQVGASSDVVIASRYQKGAKIYGLKKFRIILSNLARMWYTLMLRIPGVKDYTCGYRLYTYKIIDTAIKQYKSDLITQSSFACMMELLYKLYTCGAKICEIPFSLEYNKKEGQSKMRVLRTSFNSLKTTFKIKNKNFNIFPYIIILLLSIVILFMSCSRFKNVGLFHDAAVYLNVSRNLMQGKVLYKDIVDNKGPVLYFINALALKCGGQIGICIVEFLFIFLSFFYMYKILKLINKNNNVSLLILFVTASFFVNFFTYGISCEGYALTFSMIGLYECLKYYQNNYFTRTQCVLIGVLCSLTFFIRANLIVIFVGFAIGISIKLILEKKIKELFKYIIYSLIGFFSVTFLIFLYLISNNAINDFFEIVFLYSFSMNKCGLVQSLFFMFKMIPIPFLVILLYFFVSLYRLIVKKQKVYLSIIFSILITILFNSISITIYWHYLIAFIPIIMLSYNNLFTIFDNKYVKIILYVLLAEFVLYNSYTSLSKFNVEQPNSDIISYVKENTNYNDKIAVVGFCDEIYFLSRRDSVSKYTYILGNGAFSVRDQTNMVKEYFEDIISKKPTIIVEDDSTIEKGVKPYISLKEYEKLKDKYYEEVMVLDEKNIYRLK